jgi:alpha-tubulin suppressor-like RCC1 family protein
MKKIFTLLLLNLSFPFFGQCWQSVAAGSVHSIAIKTDGTLWAWGYNEYGQLGDGTTVFNRNVPKQIGNDNNWQSIDGGERHTVGIKNDGTIWAWGYNTTGYLGDGTTSNKSVPTQIGNESNWKNVSVGYYHTLAIKTDGTLWAWGGNIYGELGTTNYAIGPKLIGGIFNWQSIAAGSYHSMAIKTDGTLWACGNNEYGQIGDGTTTNKSILSQIGDSSDWKSVAGGDSHTIAIKNDGTLWAWGKNKDGQLGDGTYTDRNIPTKIGEDNNWQNIAGGNSHTIATKSDGTLWSWGHNDYGQLGDETTAFNRNVPKQIGNDNNWQSVSGGILHTIAIKQNGTLWAWGNNRYGQLGEGANIFSINIPIAISCSVNLGVNVFTVANEMIACPNPVKDSFKLQNVRAAAVMKIYDIKGDVVKIISTNFNEAIDISDLNKGIYILNVVDGEGRIFNEKLIKD